MPRIILRMKRKKVFVSNSLADSAAESSAAVNESSSSYLSPTTNSQNPTNPSPKPPRDKETMNCIVNMHSTSFNTDTENDNHDSASGDTCLDLLPWIKNKKPRRKLQKKPSDVHASSNISLERNRNMDDTNMGGSNESPSSKNDDYINRPILRSMVRKRSPSHGTDPTSEAEYLSMCGIEMEWPKIHIELSRKEKEEDFFKMEGIKLPLRPKRRPKAVENALQDCYPGMSLEDIKKGKYEVKERRNTKKPKQRGLKGMETDSD